MLGEEPDLVPLLLPAAANLETKLASGLILGQGRCVPMQRSLLPVLAVALLGMLGTSGCVAALVGGAGAGAGLGYTQAQKSHTGVKQAGAGQPTKGTARAKGLELQPAPGQFVDCTLKDGAKLAMSAADCSARGGAAS